MENFGVQYELSVEALSTIVKHSLKHGTSFIYGMLVGGQEEITNKENSNGKKTLISFKYAVPIFHSLPLLPMSETAFQQVKLKGLLFKYSSFILTPKNIILSLD